MNFFKRPWTSRRKAYWTWVVLFAVIALLVHPSAGSRSSHQFLSIVDGIVFGGLVFLLVAVPIGRALVRGGRWYNQQLRTLDQTNVTPQQVELMLRGHLGRQPTLLEIDATYRMIRSQHNQALANIGMLLGGLFLAGHFGHFPHSSGESHG